MDSEQLLVTAFGTVVYYDAEKQEFRHNDFDRADAREFVQWREGCLKAAWGEGGEADLSFDRMMYPGGAGRLAFWREDRF